AAERSHLHCIATGVHSSECANVLQILWRNSPSILMENVMRGRVMMILASAVLAGSLLATGAQARGGGGGHMGGGFGGGHMGGFGGGHMGGFGGGRIGGLGDARVGGLGAGHLAHAGHEGFGR